MAVRVAASLAVPALMVSAIQIPAQAAENPHGFGATTAEELANTYGGKQKDEEAPTANRFIVKFKDKDGDRDQKMQALNDVVKEHKSQATFTRQMYDGSYVVTLDPPVPADQIQDLRGSLESKDEVDYADIDSVQAPRSAPNDEHYQYQWHLQPDKGVNAEAAWDHAKGDGTVIAVVDSGITKHPDLDSKVLPGIDMIQDPNVSQDGDARDEDPTDNGDWNVPGECSPASRGANSSFHGTHVAGIAAAETDNNIGVAGVAPGGQILPVRALGRCGGYASDIADAVAWAAGAELPDTPVNEHPASVINMSLGGRASQCQPLYQSAIDFANDHGATVVVAAGNENQPTDNVQPANCNGVIVVGATGPEGNRSYYSNFGSQVVVSAPGGDMSHGEEGGILSTVNMGKREPAEPGYSYMEGTSMATPVVSGVVSLIKSAVPDLDNEKVRDILTKSAKPFASGGEQGMGAGIVDAEGAVCAALEGAGKSCDDKSPDGDKDPSSEPTSSPAPGDDTPGKPGKPGKPGHPGDPSDPAPAPGHPGKPGDGREPGHSPHAHSVFEKLLSPEPGDDHGRDGQDNPGRSPHAHSVFEKLLPWLNEDK